jgi:hypothetical protein
MGKVLSYLKPRNKKASNDMSIRTISLNESDVDGIQVIEDIDGFVSIEIIERTQVMNNDILVEILSNLSFKSLLQLERVSKQFRYCVGFVLQNVTGIEGKQLINNNCEDSRHSTRFANIEDIDKDLELSEDSFLTTEDRVILRRRMNALLEKCPNIRCVSLPFARIPVVTQFLEYIGPHVLNIECLRITFDGNIILTNTFFILMSTAISDKLIHLDVSLTYNNLFLNSSFYQFINSLNALQTLTIRCPIESINPLTLIESLGENVRKIIFIFE